MLWLPSYRWPTADHQPGVGVCQLRTGYPKLQRPRIPLAARHHREPAPGAAGWAAIETAQKISSGCWLTSARAAITERRGRNTATVAVARKLLTLVCYGLRDGEIRALNAPQKAAA